MHEESEFIVSLMFILLTIYFSVRSTCETMDVELILGERLDLSSTENGKAKVNALGQKVVRTVTGREIAADLLVRPCAGNLGAT
jgi:hypothetical protein